MPDNFDLLVANSALLDGTLVADTRDADNQRSRVLRTALNNEIRVRWELNGILINLNVLGGTWELQAFFEGIGATTESNIPVAPIQVAWNPTGIYNVAIPVPAGAIPAGVYKMVVLLRFLNLVNAPTPMTGFVEIPMVQFS